MGTGQQSCCFFFFFKLKKFLNTHFSVTFASELARDGLQTIAVEAVLTVMTITAHCVMHAVQAHTA